MHQRCPNERQKVSGKVFEAILGEERETTNESEKPVREEGGSDYPAIPEVEILTNHSTKASGRIALSGTEIEICE